MKVRKDYRQDRGRPTSRRLLLTALSLLLLSTSGCRQATSLTYAVVCQQTAWRIGPAEPEQWSFNGLDARVRPRIRPGSYASDTLGIRFLDPHDLGPHTYRFNWSEKNGILYTCQAGHIDIAHVRKAADWTGYLAATTLQYLQRGQTAFRFKLHEPSVYFVELTFPPDWSSRPAEDRRRIACEVASSLGQHLAYTALTWHEILTWFGYRPKPWQTEFPSAFSWEDTYSNLLGIYVAADALAAGERPFSQTVTLGLQQAIDSLEPQPADVAQGAARAMRGDWFSKRGPFTLIHMRNFDIGFDDGYVTPTLVSGVPSCDGVQSRPIAIPTLAPVAARGFSVKLEIAPNGWEQRKILAVVYPDEDPRPTRIDPAAHFPRLLSYMEATAPRYGLHTADGHATGHQSRNTR